MTRTSWILLFSLGSIWGGTFFCTEILLLTMTPFHIVFFRVSLGALAMLVFIHLRGQRLPTNWQNWRWFLMMGFFNNAFPFTCIVFGQQYITGGLASILNSFTAFIAVVTGAIFLSDERITWPRTIGTMLGVAGVAVTMGLDHLMQLSLTSIGQFLVLLSTISYAIASVLGRLQMGRTSVEVSTTGMLICSSGWMLVFSLMVEGVPVMAMDTTSILAILAYAIPFTSVAYLLYFNLLRRAGAANTMLVTIIVPVSALLLDAFALGEVISMREVIGFGIIAIGLLILSGRVPVPGLKPR